MILFLQPRINQFSCQTQLFGYLRQIVFGIESAGIKFFLIRAAAAGEHEEWSLDYPHFADVAEQEGFPMIAAMYRNISIAEKGHEERYLAFVNNIENMTVFAKEGEVVWQCRNCGYITVGKEAPEVCPACLHPQAYFEVKKENY